MSEITPTVSVKYSCSGCGLHRVAVDVPARTDEDVVAWLREIATPALVADHSKRSRDCHPDAFDEVLIRSTGTDRVGGAAVQ